MEEQANQSGTGGAKIFAALAKAQGAMRGASKDRQNPHFKSSYATLSSVWDAIREPLSANGLSIVQLVRSSDPGLVRLETMVTHESGEYITDGGCTIKPTKTDPQGFGSALTYLRRYSLMAIAGIAPEDDDDGNAASSGTPARPVKTITKQQAETLKAQSTPELMTSLLGVVGKAQGARVVNVEQIPAEWFERSRKWLENAAAKAAEGADNAAA